MIWHTLANGDVQTTIEIFCLTLRADRYVRFFIRDNAHLVCSGSEDTIAGAMASAIYALRRLLGQSLQTEQIEQVMNELYQTPVPLTKQSSLSHDTRS